MTPVTKMEPDDQYVTLQAGQYWQAVEAVDEDILKGDVLLIKSVRDVDKEAHTIILRPHPRWYAANLRSDTEYRFLVQDFLSKFIPCPDYKRIRSAELAEVQGRVTALQNQLAEVSANPESMKEHINTGLREWEKKQKLLPGAADDLPAPTPDATLDASLTTGKIETMKLSMAKAHEVAVLQANYIKEKVEEIGETVQAMTPFYQEQAAAALASTEDIQTHVAKLMTGIASLDLYVGTDVYIEQVSKGKDAPDGPDGEHLPLTIMQRKLYMDEELSAWADVGEKFDAKNDKEFFKTLRKYKSLVDQIFPTERCIVCMAVTRRNLDYGNAWENAIKNEKNKTVFLLARNGENIHVVYSPVESHMKSPKLFPSAKDIDDIFRDTKWWGEDEGKRITFNDVKYTDKLSEHEAVAVHYKRFLILLAGLDHRENLFGTFYDEPKGMRFISMLFQQKYMRFIYDADGSGKMLPGENKPKFPDWAAAKNAYLQSGSRVICMWRDVMNTETAPGVCKYDRSSRNYTDRWMADPTESYGIKIAFREGKEIFVKCPVKREVYGRYVDTHTQEFEAKVSLSKYGDRWTIGYICLDAVKAEELEWYVHDRENRHDFLSYIRLFKSAIKHLHAEEKQEAPTRERLRLALETGGVAAGGRAKEIIDRAVIAWRAAHRGESLASANETAEFNKLLTQMWVIARSTDESVESDRSRAQAWAERNGLKPLRLVMSGKAQAIALYCAPKAEEEDNRLWPMAWVHRIVLARQKDGFGEQSRQWKVLPSVNAAETVLHEWEGVSMWADRAAPVDRFSDKQAAFEHILNYEKNSTLFKPMMPGAWDAMYDIWLRLRQQMQSNSKGYVQNPSCFVPFGLVLEDGKLNYLAVGTHNAAHPLYEHAPDKERRAKLVKEFSERYRDTKSAVERITGKEPDYSGNFDIYEFSIANEPQPHGICDFSAHHVSGNDDKFDLNKLDAIVKKLIKKAKKDHEVPKFWVPGIQEDN